MEQENLSQKRHSLAHLLGAAVLELYPKSNLTLGPAIDDGFYYDIDVAGKITEEDLPKIESKMKELLSGWKNFTGKEISYEEAKELYKENPYKLELIEEHKDKGLSIYSAGSPAVSKAEWFSDLCRGGHIENPSAEIKEGSWKLDRVAGAYWRGDENNKMLTRIYGLAFETKEDLDVYIKNLEEAEKRDHRKLGAQLKIFTVSPLVGSGLPLLQPNGIIIRKEIEDYLWSLHKDKGYDRVWTPHIAKIALYETSGHAEKFGDELFRVQGKEESFIMKPMNCPHHMQIFSDNHWSYRDMPVRYFEPATVYRDEKTGQLGGLTRVRAITQDDGHLFCRSIQIGQEIKTIVSIIKDFYTTMGMIDGYWVRLSLRGDDKSKYLGTDEVWEIAEKALTDVCIEENLPYKPAKDEAAFYGPKLDFMFKDAIGREWQLATIQCDFNLPERFNLSFINEKGEKERPVVIHRAISGSLERFMGVMIEHFAGIFPTWLSPVQVAIVPVKEDHLEFSKEIENKLRCISARTKIISSKENLGTRIHEAKKMNTPYVIVIGDKEKDSGELTIEKRDGEKIKITVEEFINNISEEIKNRI
jgi:threonyl-tRNA synthetase